MQREWTPSAGLCLSEAGSREAREEPEGRPGSLASLSALPRPAWNSYKLASEEPCLQRTQAVEWNDRQCSHLLGLHQAPGARTSHRLLLSPPGSSWLFLAPPGLARLLLAQPGSAWLISIPLGPLAPLGSSWLLLAPLGSSWRPPGSIACMQCASGLQGAPWSF